MKMYMVGGAVRDTLMGVVPKDIDYVVVGATPADMIAQGFEQVGASFPVFLKDGCEYALARTERKTGVGYNGFETFYDPNVTLEDDLYRRDLTINAMAMDLETGKLIDPYGGQIDIATRVLRHTSGAFVEDPVRVLRTARFAARYGFAVDPGTVELMRKVVPELDHVPAERVFAEFEKGLMEDHPYKMIEVLHDAHAERAKVMQPYMRMWMARSLLNVTSDMPLYVRFALASSSFTDADFVDCKIPTDLSRVSKAVHRNIDELLKFDRLAPADVVRLLDKLRAFSDPDLLVKVREVLAVYFKMWTHHDVEMWTRAFTERVEAARSIDAAAVAASCSDPKRIREAIFDARAWAVREKGA